MYNMKGLGKRISAYRKIMGITQGELADRLNITAQAVSKWENDLSFPDISVLPSLAKELNISIDKLFGSDEYGIKDNYDEMFCKPKFPRFLSEKMKLVYIFDDVACYSEKEVDIANKNSVIFKDGSITDLKSLRIVNKGAGEICFKFRSDIPADKNFDINRTCIDEAFDGISSIKMDIIDASFELIRSEDKKTHVTATGSPFFIENLKIVKEDEKHKLSVKCGLRGGFKKNKVTIAFGKDLGDYVITHLNGAGKCIIKVPFKKGDIEINGFGEIEYDDISEVSCKIYGSGDIKCNRSGNAHVDIGGSGDFKSGEVFGMFSSKISGSGNIYLESGKLDSFAVRIIGSGAVHAENICTKTADISAKGLSDITIGRVIEESDEKYSRNSSIKVLKRG